MPIDPMAAFPPQPYRKVIQPMFRTLAVAASGMSAQRTRLEVVAQNIANAEVTQTANGGPYRRQVVQMQVEQVPGQPFEVNPDGTPAPFRLPNGDPLPYLGGVRVTAIQEDMTQGPLVYDPGHPDANAAGYVQMPNVSITDEMVDLMDARRVYEANATVFQSAKAMFKAAVNI